MTPTSEQLDGLALELMTAEQMFGTCLHPNWVLYGMRRANPWWKPRWILGLPSWFRYRRLYRQWEIEEEQREVDVDAHVRRLVLDDAPVFDLLPLPNRPTEKTE